MNYIVTAHDIRALIIAAMGLEKIPSEEEIETSIQQTGHEVFYCTECKYIKGLCYCNKFERYLIDLDGFCAWGEKK